METLRRAIVGTINSVLHRVRHIWRCLLRKALSMSMCLVRPLLLLMSLVLHWLLRLKVGRVLLRLKRIGVQL